MNANAFKSFLIVLALPLLSQAKTVFNLECQDYKQNKYQISVINEEIHFCGANEKGLITGEGNYETSLRAIELRKFSEINPTQYELIFMVGLTNQPCARCHGDTEHASQLTLKCELNLKEEATCQAQKQGPNPELGDKYNKVLRYGVGENYWDQVPWVTLYDPKTQDFAIYVFDSENQKRIERYNYWFYSGENINKEELTLDIKNKLKSGYQIHPYSTNTQGLKLLKQISGLSVVSKAADL